MYNSRVIYYNEKHSVSFGSLSSRTTSGTTYDIFVDSANTWTTWHLIPASNLSVVHPTVATKYITEDGYNGVIDLTDFMFGTPNYGMRKGSFQFYVDINQQNAETVHSNITSVLHGVRTKMRLMDDPVYYYDGRFSVDKLDPDPAYPKITIGYQLEPYKYRIQIEGSTPTLWDPFNFETDYDYYTLFGENITVANETKRFSVRAYGYGFTPTVTWALGTVTCNFGGVTRTLNSSGSAELGKASPGNNTLTISGAGIITIKWRGGSL